MKQLNLILEDLGELILRKDLIPLYCGMIFFINGHLQAGNMIMIKTIQYHISDLVNTV